METKRIYEFMACFLAILRTERNELVSRVLIILTIFTNVRAERSELIARVFPFPRNLEQEGINLFLDF